MAERKDLRLVTGPSHEWVVRRRGAVIAKAKNFAAMAHWVLSPLIEGATDGHEEIPIRGKHDSRRGRPAIINGVGDKNIVEINQRMTVEAASCERCCHSFFQRFGVCEVDELVFGVPR